jgi:hypothetical protein
MRPAYTSVDFGMNEKILTQHPDPNKRGVNIERGKYDTIKTEIINILSERGEVSFKDLMDEINQILHESFEGSINWYFTTVKLDLEARGFFERITHSKPQRLRFTGRD